VATPYKLAHPAVALAIVDQLDCSCSSSRVVGRKQRREQRLVCGSGEVVEVLGVTAEGVFARQRLWLGREVHVHDIVLLSPLEMFLLASSPSASPSGGKTLAGESVGDVDETNGQAGRVDDDLCAAGGKMQSKQQALTGARRGFRCSQAYIVECKAQGTWEVETCLPFDFGPTARASAFLTGSVCIYVCVHVCVHCARVCICESTCEFMYARRILAGMDLIYVYRSRKRLCFALCC
jgi:hypothetical protein